MGVEDWATAEQLAWLAQAEVYAEAAWDWDCPPDPRGMLEAWAGTHVDGLEAGLRALHGYEEPVRDRSGPGDNWCQRWVTAVLNDAIYGPPERVVTAGKPLDWATEPGDSVADLRKWLPER